MTEDEKRLLRDAASLLATGTSNSLIAENRQGWSELRDRVVPALREMAR